MNQELRIKNELKFFAEAGGFEPPVPLRILRFSRPVPSTTQPRLHLYPLKADCGPEGNCPVLQLGTWHPELICDSG